LLLYVSNPKQLSGKKICVAPKKAIVTKMGNPRWWPRNGCDGRLMVKILNLGEFGAKS